MPTKTRRESIARRNLPMAVRHLAFLAALRRGRRTGAHDAVPRMLRLARSGITSVSARMALHLHLQRGIGLRERTLAAGTTVHRQLQNIHWRGHVHTERRVAHWRIADRPRVGPGPGALRSVPARRAGVAAAAHRGRSPAAAVSRLELITVRTHVAPVPRADLPEAWVRSELRSANPSACQAAAPPVVLPAAELSRVTEHVLRTLDRRVLSYRERTGQLWA